MLTVDHRDVERQRKGFFFRAIDYYEKIMRIQLKMNDGGFDLWVSPYPMTVPAGTGTYCRNPKSGRTQNVHSPKIVEVLEVLSSLTQDVPPLTRCSSPANPPIKNEMNL